MEKADSYYKSVKFFSDENAKITKAGGLIIKTDCKDNDITFQPL